MSYFDYQKSQEVANAPFYALIMAAMRNADTDNLEAMKAIWPNVWSELKARYNAPAGCLSYDEFVRYIGDESVTKEMFEGMSR